VVARTSESRRVAFMEAIISRGRRGRGPASA
jgi:hypothetical protein